MAVEMCKARNIMIMMVAGREECRQCSREKGWQSVVLLICTVNGEGLAETWQGLAEKIKRCRTCCRTKNMNFSEKKNYIGKIRGHAAIF